MTESDSGRVAVVEDVLEQLVNQFTDPLCFLRELIQNAIDAGSTKIDVSCTFEDESPTSEPGVEPVSGGAAAGSPGQLGTAIIRVVDFGEGMDGQIIDTRLTRLFSSDKEGDLTKIGRFGIGFVSVFAMQPDAVCVDTGRYGESWRLVFAPDRTFTRIRLSEPVEGTTIRLFKAMLRSQFEPLERRVRRALLRYCPHVEVALRYHGELLSTPLTLGALDAQVKIAASAQGATMVVGFTSAGMPDRATLYGRGLTLLVRQSEIPGVSFKLNSPALVPTHGRDGVVQSEHSHALLTAVQALARGPLIEELSQRLEAALQEQPDALGAEILGLQHCLTGLLRRGVALPDSCLQRSVARSPHGELYTLRACQQAAREGRLYSVAVPSPLSAAVGATGQIALEEGQGELLAALCGTEPPRLERELMLPLPLSKKETDETQWAGGEALRTAVMALLRAAEAPVGTVELGSLGYPGSGAGELPGVVQSQPFTVSRLVQAHPKDQRWPEAGDDHGLPPRNSWVLNADYPILKTLLPLTESEPELCAYILIKLCLVGNPSLLELDSRLLRLSLEQRRQRQAAPMGERLRLIRSLTRVDGEIISSGSFTIDPERVREKIRHARFENPLRYVLELVQAACLKGATHIDFRFGADDMQMHFNGEPFQASDFEQLYSSLFLKGEGREGQARSLLALGLCAALQLDPALIYIESGSSFFELRPGHADRHGALLEPVPVTRIRIRQRLGLELLKRYVDHLGGQLTEELLLQERCHHACMAIELDGKIISQGHTFPDVLYSQTFSGNGVAGTVAVAPLPESSPTDGSVQMAEGAALGPSLVRLIKNGVWVDTQLPIELLPGFVAVAESSGYRLDFSREHVVQDSQYGEALRAVAAAQVELLANLCERSVQGPSVDLRHLRALLRGLLSRLGGLAPLLRWSKIPLQQLPVETLTEGSSLWPLEVEKGAALLEVPIFHTTIGDMVSLRLILNDLALHRCIAYSSYRSHEPDPKRPLVLHLREAGDQDLLHELFGSALECRDAAIQLAWKREHNRTLWLSRGYKPLLGNQLLLARAPLHGSEITGEIGLERPAAPAPACERLLNRTSTMRLLLIKDGCLLVEKRIPFPVPDLTVVAMGEFTPSYLFDDVLSDARLAAVVDAIFAAIPSLIEQLASASLDGAAVPTAEAQAWRACVLRRLLMLTLSREARRAARIAMGVSGPAAGDVEHSMLSPHPLWMQLYEVPLIETLDGTLLRPVQLAQLAEKNSPLPILCPSPTTLPKRLESWASLSYCDAASTALWQKAHVQAKSVLPVAEPPALILYLAKAERPLLAVLGEQLPALRLVDAEPWLRSVEAVAQGSSQSTQLLLPSDCTVTVPLIGVAGVLGVLEEAEFQRAAQVDVDREPRVAVALLCRQHQIGAGQLYLPGGQYLSAVADHPMLKLADGGRSLEDNEALFAVRSGIAAALPELLAALAQHPPPWPSLFAPLLLDAVTALFPRPVFRRAYECLHAMVAADAPVRGPDTAEREYAALLRLTVATSVERVAEVLQKQLAHSSQLLVLQVARELSPGLAETLPAAALSPEREGAELNAATQLPAGSMAWIDALYPDSEGMPFAERALLPLPALGAAPLLVTADGASLTFAEVIRDYQQHGQVLYTTHKTLPPELAPQRLVISDSQSQVLPVLQGLFGADNVREISVARPLMVPPPPPVPLRWQPSAAVTAASASAQSERLLSAVLQELRSVRGCSERLLNNVNLAWLQIRDSEQQQPVICDSQQFIINRRHPTVQLVLRSAASDPQCVRFIASAVYTALSVRLAAVSLTDAAHFHRGLAMRAAADTLERPLSSARPNLAKVSTIPA